MRLTVDHHYETRFPRTLRRVVLALRVTPDDSHDQTVAGWRIGPDRDARLRPARDGFGNVLTMVYADGPLEALAIQVTGEVFTGPSSGVLPAGREPLPPALFRRPTPATQPDAAVTAFAHEAVGTVADPIERLHDLNVAVHGRGRIEAGAPPAGGAAAAMTRAALASGDLAQLFVTAARVTGAPARVVSGYCGDGGTEAAPRFWAEAWVERVGWVGFDPGTGLSAGEGHARVAHALDLAGVAPVTGG